MSVSPSKLQSLDSFIYSPVPSLGILPGASLCIEFAEALFTSMSATVYVVKKGFGMDRLKEIEIGYLDNYCKIIIQTANGLQAYWGE